MHQQKQAATSQHTLTCRLIGQGHFPHCEFYYVLVWRPCMNDHEGDEPFSKAKRQSRLYGQQVLKRRGFRFYLENG